MPLYSSKASVELFTLSQCIIWETEIMLLHKELNEITYTELRLEEEMAAHSSIFVWKIPWMDELGGLQSIGVAKSRTRLKWLHFTSLTCLDESVNIRYLSFPSDISFYEFNDTHCHIFIVCIHWFVNLVGLYFSFFFFSVLSGGGGINKYEYLPY